MVSTCAWLCVWRIWVKQTSRVPLLNTPGFLLIIFYVAEFQLLYSWAAHNQNLIPQLATQIEVHGASLGDLQAGIQCRGTSRERFWGRDPPNVNAGAIKSGIRCSLAVWLRWLLKDGQTPVDLQASPLINFLVKKKAFLLAFPLGNVFLALLFDQDEAVGVETAQSLRRYLFPRAATLGERNSHILAGWS